MASGRLGPSRLLRFDSLLLDAKSGTWITPAFVELSSTGTIRSISAKAPKGSASGSIEKIRGTAIPGLVNGHSHAFQFAMAGLTECVSPGRPEDTFWTWRERMYQLALQLSPEEIGIITAAVYAEMLRHGYTSVVEFHYIHHQPSGKPYRNRAELAERVVDAAKTAGIDLTLAPVFYNQGDFGKPALDEQRRFLSKDPDEYLKLWHSIGKICQENDYRTALCVHSLRAASTDHLKAVFAAGSRKTPRHMHIAEQEKEVQKAVQFLGSRPIRWMLDHIELNESFHFTHATQIDSGECRDLARSRVGAILCPSTEGNLGDGFFPLEEYARSGGRFAIGSDSHIGLSPFEELRWLEYGQRLQKKRRNILLDSSHTDSGSYLYAETLEAGRRSAGLEENAFQVGQSFDAAVIDSEHYQIAGTAPDRLLSTLIFGVGSKGLLGTIVKGKWVVKSGTHIRGKAIFSAYRKIAEHLRR